MYEELLFRGDSVEGNYASYFEGESTDEPLEALLGRLAAAPDLTGLSGGRTLGPGRSGPSRRRLAEPTASARDVRGSGGTNG